MRAMDNHITLIDFGSSKCRGTAISPYDERADTILGTPDFMSPEMLIRCAPYSALIDFWALGCVTHELLTGKPPFGGEADEAGGEDAASEHSSIPSISSSHLGRVSGGDERDSEQLRVLLGAVLRAERGHMALPNYLTPEAVEVIRGLLAPADRRLSHAELKGLQWFEGVDWAKLEAKDVYIP